MPNRKPNKPKQPAGNGVIPRKGKAQTQRKLKKIAEDNARTQLLLQEATERELRESVLEHSPDSPMTSPVTPDYSRPNLMPFSGRSKFPELHIFDTFPILVENGPILMKTVLSVCASVQRQTLRRHTNI